MMFKQVEGLISGRNEELKDKEFGEKKRRQIIGDVSV